MRRVKPEGGPPEHTEGVGKSAILCQNRRVMVSAWLTGILGAILTYWVGSRYFGFDLKDWAIALGTTNVVGFFSLLLTLALERRPAIRRILMGNAFKTWAVLAILYTSGLAALDPALRNPLTLAALWAPLVLGTGFMLPLWGLAQDRLIAWEHHRRVRRAGSPDKRWGSGAALASNQEFASPKRDAIRVES